MAWRKKKGTSKPIASIHLTEIVEISVEEGGEVLLAEQILTGWSEAETHSDEKDENDSTRPAMHTKLCSYAEQSVEQLGSEEVTCADQQGSFEGRYD